MRIKIFSWVALIFLQAFTCRFRKNWIIIQKVTYGTYGREHEKKHNYNQIVYTCFSIKRSAPENSIETRVIKMATLVQKCAATVINQNQKPMIDHAEYTQNPFNEN